MTTTEPLPKAWTPDGYRERNTALRLLPDRVRVLLATGWARSAMPAWEAEYPQDDRPRKAIEVAEGWAVVSTAAADAAYAAAYASADAAYGKWRQLYRAYCHARGPECLAYDPAWKTDTTVSLAKEIVATRSFDLMPILADALQDAGCDHAGLLAHLRGDAEEMTLADWSLCHLLGLWGVAA